MIDRSKRGSRSPESRQRLIDAAVESIIEVGYARTTISEIVKRAGMTKGAHVYHFASKLDLMRVTVRQLFERGNSLLQDVDQRPLDSVPDFEELLQVIAEVALAREGMALYEVWMASRTDEELRRIFVEFEQANESHRDQRIRRVIGEGNQEEAEMLDVMEGFFLLLRGLAMQLIVDPGALSGVVWLHSRKRLAQDLHQIYHRRALPAARMEIAP